jgi:hypothetical protein
MECKMSEIPSILKRVSSEGYAVFTNGEYNLNIIGVRSQSQRANKFDDRMYVVYKDGDGQWVELNFKVTTDPGKYWLENPMKVTGTAILVAGQYRGVYKIDKHRGKYDALCQRGGRVKIYRDNNKDVILDHNEENIHSGYYGINIHRSNPNRESTSVEKWSAGCQVFADPSDFDLFMQLCKISAKKYGETFTYTLLED